MRHNAQQRAHEPMQLRATRGAKLDVATTERARACDRRFRSNFPNLRRGVGAAKAAP
jgi:hypothetical protein